jgi:hypothetical protein
VKIGTANQCLSGRSHHETALQAFAGQSSITCHAGRLFVHPDREEVGMRPQAVIPLNEPAAEAKYTVLTGLMKRLGSGRFARALFKAPPVTENDPYLLILLADQELDEGREEQARYLVEAAYEAFDQRSNICVFRIRPAG